MESQPNPDKASTIRLAKHIPSGFTYKVVAITEDLAENHVTLTYRGPNAAEVFVKHMVDLEERLLGVLRDVKPMEMTEADVHDFKTATNCSTCICRKTLDTDRVREHCHVTGKYRGAAHNSCNLNFKQMERIPVFFHNLREYDSHLIMEAIGKIKHKKIYCIPQNHEKYISFSLGKI